MHGSQTGLQFTFVCPPEWLVTDFTPTHGAVPDARSVAKMLMQSDDDGALVDAVLLHSDDDHDEESVQPAIGTIKPSPEPGVRVKIENGVVFFKPAMVGAVDVIPVERSEQRWRAVIPADHPMKNRLFSQLERLGWSLRHPFFELHPAQRGWHGISLGPLRHRPTDRPWVQVKPIIPPVIVEPVLFRGPVTAEDVARIVGVPYR